MRLSVTSQASISQQIPPGMGDLTNTVHAANDLCMAYAVILIALWVSDSNSFDVVKTIVHQIKHGLIIYQQPMFAAPLFVGAVELQGWISIHASEIMVL
ncbi:MAG: hypothetical protein ABW201_14390 [Candidatus Thiodiazotropha sp.]